MSHSSPIPLAVNSNLVFFLLFCTSVFTMYFITQKHRFSMFPVGVFFLVSIYFHTFSFSAVLIKWKAIWTECRVFVVNKNLFSFEVNCYNALY